MTINNQNNLVNFLRSLDKDKLIYIYLNNQVVIFTEPKYLHFFDDYFIYDGKSRNGTMYFPDQEKIYPKGYERFNQVGIPYMNAIPYSAISLVTEKL